MLTLRSADCLCRRRGGKAGDDAMLARCDLRLRAHGGVVLVTRQIEGGMPGLGIGVPVTGYTQRRVEQRSGNRVDGPRHNNCRVINSWEAERQKTGHHPSTALATPACTPDPESGMEQMI